MICPKCKKNETSILKIKTSFESLTNTVRRQRTCKCGNLFVTYEIDKLGLKAKSAKILKNSIQLKKKRKPTIKEEWIDFRIVLYGLFRIKAIISSYQIADNKFEKKYKFGKDTYIGPTKFPNKKSYFVVLNRYTKDYTEVKIERVKQTIKQCIETIMYWKKKKSLFKNIIEPDFKNKRTISDEINEYNRSITSYVRKDKYNSDFYNKYLDKMLTQESPIDLTDEEIRKLKKYFFSAQRWIWYKEVR